MIDWLATATIAAALLAAGWAVLLAVLNRPLTLQDWTTLGVAALVGLQEVALLAQTVIGAVLLAGDGHEAVSGATFFGYLLTALLLLPLAGFWSIVDRSRWGASVLAVGCLTTAVMVVRLNQIWAGHA
ncbi:MULTISPECIES: hypothetical protein [Actinosynnema]|uniref:hypothetical protein n=1 Tax=Actinosynnema TaxID=40566 RepID=UPI0020A48F79|nr:hypothetical protein [Actinosynnema pretiosum]MCP2099470.1 hypothetical protein [Actinosynnema pretiosum]